MPNTDRTVGYVVPSLNGGTATGSRIIHHGLEDDNGGQAHAVSPVHKGSGAEGTGRTRVARC